MGLFTPVHPKTNQELIWEELHRFELELERESEDYKRSQRQLDQHRTATTSTRS